MVVVLGQFENVDLARLEMKFSKPHGSMDPFQRLNLENFETLGK